MLRWSEIDDTTIFGITYKMYREPYRAGITAKSPHKNLDLDHYAYRHLGSELLSYRILDVNFKQYMEERGNLSRMGVVTIPLSQDEVNTVL